MSLALKNILANYGSRVWGLVSLYLFTPIYLKILGLEAYGVIAFYTVVYGLATFADAGITSAMDKEFAKSNTNVYKLGLLGVFERVYALICCALCFTIYFFADEIAERWLKSSVIPTDQLVGYVKLIGFGVGTQLMPMIYLGSLMGLQKQVRVGIIQFSWSSIKSIGAIAVLILVKADLNVFFVWQICCNVIFILISRMGLKKLFVYERSMKLTIGAVPKSIWKYIGGMFFISVLGAFNVQVDKVITSKLFNLSEYGYYSLASIISQIPFLTTIPIVLAIFPFMNRSVAEGSDNILRPVFKRFSFLISALIMPLCAILVIYGGDVFEQWQKDLFMDQVLKRELSSIIILLTIGNTFLALQQLPFYLLLANGRTLFTIVQAAVQFAIMIPASYFFIGKYGLIGASIPVAVLQFAGYLYLLTIISKKYLTKYILDHLFFCLLVPLGVTVFISAIVWFLSRWFGINNYFIICGGLIGVLSIFINVQLYNKFSSDKLSISKLL